jgi:hypothetical protein
MQSCISRTLRRGEALPAAGGYCTQSCWHDPDCGAGAQCLSALAHGGLCFASCSEDAPCRDGYTCVIHLRDGDPTAAVCAPAPS